ncbi:MAG: elongation factor Ts [Dehalococcoidia bacterium]
MTTTEAIRALRQQTGAGVMDCKRALDAAGGDLTKAEELLQEQGLAKAAKRAGRETREGLVDAYVHSGSRLAALIEVNCETDFVARTEEFHGLVHDLAMQVAAMGPVYLDAPTMPQDDPRPVEEVCLLQQPFIKDPARTVQDLIQELAARTGENIRVRRFSRFALGEDETGG